jgi:hypothetical protein
VDALPQIAVLSAISDRPRVEPLVKGLRERGLRVWWDDSLVPGEDRMEQTMRAVAQVPLACLVITDGPLSYNYFHEAFALLQKDNRRFVPIRLEATSDDRLPQEIAIGQWIDLQIPEHLPGAIDRILEALRIAETAPRPSSSSRRVEPERPPLRLLLGDGTQSETWTVSEDLHRVLVVAARVNRFTSDERDYPISFRSLLLSLFIAPSATWVRDLAGRVNFDVTPVFEAKRLDRAVAPELVKDPPRPGELSEPLRTTRSAAALLNSAREYAGRSTARLGIHHVVATLIYAPAGHEGELESYGFDRVTWANALLEEVERRFPTEAELFRSLRDEAFPVAPRPLDNAQQQSPPPTGPWAAADADLKQALAWAAAAAKDPDGVGLRELLGGLLKEGGEEGAFPQLLASMLAEQVDVPHWQRLHSALALPTVAATTPLGSLPARTPEVDAVLDKALALRAKPDDPLTVTLVFLALWKPATAGEPAPIDPLLSALPLDPEVFLQKLHAELASRGRPHASIVQDILALRRMYQPWDRPHVDNDRVAGAIPPDQDLLDARKPALRFAKLLAAKAVKPPVALGLFGNWGSGKTFFMGLMQDRIADLAATGGSGYVRRPVQIEFNAWHYHDTNLWASLAMRIFAELARALGGKTPSAVELKRKELHRKISSSTARRTEAVERRDQALDRRASAAKELEAKQAQRDELQRTSIHLRLQAAWKVVRTKPAFARLRSTADGLAKHFGITAAVDSAEDLGRLRQDIDQTSARALGVFTAIGQRFQGVGGGARTVGLLALVVASALALGWGVENVAKRLQIQWPDFSGTVVQIAALVSAVAAWCGRRVKEVRSALDTIAEVEANLAAAERDVPQDPELTKLQTQIESLDKEIRKAGEELGAAEREIAEATAEIDRINRGGLVYDFLQERRVATSYVGQLGLISTIREDLDKLKALLEDFGAHGKDPIERIILYIDDLDRCHPDKVVEVLQAVHLLLAFDLFNVVVGVDARWLERSLRRQYVGKADGEGARDGDEGDDTFSPQDYLEKIFQIPYALAPIDETGFKKLIGGLIETRTEWREKERQRSLDDAARRAASERNTVDAGQTAAAGDGGGSVPTEDRLGDEKSADTSNVDDTATREEPEPSKSVEPALFFEDHEETFIQLLHGFIDRPRLAKRFVNIYRLLRVRADDEQESATFAASASARDYRAALVLLAVHVGHPKVASKLIQALETAAEDGTWARLLDDLEKGRCEAVPCSEPERNEIGRISAKLARLGGQIPDELDAYRRWAPRVACYSFDWHRAAPFPRRGAR